MFTHSCHGETCGDVLAQTKFAEHREVWDYLELRADKAAQGEQTAQSKLSESEHQMKSLLEEQRIQMLSDARSEMNMLEFFFFFKKKKTGSADRALRESNRPIHSHR